MAEIKCVINDVKAGKSYARAVEDHVLTGRKIGDKVPGSIVGLTGYELEISGGSDSAGFPMMKSLDTGLRKRIILKKGFALKDVKKNVRIRRSVRGNQINQFSAQINLKIDKYGSKGVEELLGIHPKEKEAPAEAKAEEPKKEAPKAEEKKE
ncbi:MAG: S6e family ribosomal protein [Nanoarchaeota archaeon]